MGFPVSTLKAVEIDEDRPTLPQRSAMTFLGMYGGTPPIVEGLCRRPRLDDIAQRREGHEALTSFLDIFSHRITTQYYRMGWRKICVSGPPASRRGRAMPHRSVCWDWSDFIGIPGTAETGGNAGFPFLALLGNISHAITHPQC